MSTKAASPIRLKKSLMESAAVYRVAGHRTEAEQIEFWASVGRDVTNMMTPADLLALKAGLARIKVERIESPAVDSDSVFAKVRSAAGTAKVKAALSEGAVRYQASKQYPGKLEQVGPDGTVRVGLLRQGQFEQITG